MRPLFQKKLTIPSPSEALPGRDQPLPDPGNHFVFKRPLSAPCPTGMEQALFGMGCFWGAEKLFWRLRGVHLTSVGYAAGHTPNPTYEEVCSGQTGHNEVVNVIFDPQRVAFFELLRVFWTGHDPTQGMRQGNDTGTQYRSGIYLSSSAQMESAVSSQEVYQDALTSTGYGTITTEIIVGPAFYFAEAYHQQYLAKFPGGYCGLGGTGVMFPEVLSV